ncbi:cytochrome P450 6B6 isoform X1 [Plutella xylostella]|uniref:cytochrome P450 6B6 isoform X1 n=1 Tax=Plutella xylostella TaxID=51655 RepID=UPI00203258BA|nr:cytochrome P450 6B6 isoform X1 [Plutella xylostella]
MLYVVALLAVALAALYYWSISKYDYWKKKNIKYPEPTALFGNYREYLLQRHDLGEVTQGICKQFPDEPLIGAYYGTQPVAIVQEPELLKLILAKDFYHFSGREVSDHTHKEILTRNMFFTSGDNWRVLRQNLTPLFSSAKMKSMFHLIEKCSRDFEKCLEEECAMSDAVEVRTLMARFTMDCIGACAFGLNTDVLQKNSESNPFRQIGEKIFEVSTVRGFLTAFRSILPTAFYAVGLKVFPIRIFNFFQTVLMSVIRERSLQESSRQDFVDMILALKKEKYITGDSLKNMKDGSEKLQIKVDDEFLVAQCVMFFAAGFETSSTTTSFTLLELAKHPEHQQRVIDEVDAYLASRGEVQYDCTTELPFLESCIAEALRLYPTLAVITRDVTEDYTFPNGLKLEKGLRVHIPLRHIQRNPKYFSNPDEFLPDRFSPEEKKKIAPYTYFPFGEGPRICIGMRFAKMQLMAGLVTLFKSYRVELSPSMPKETSYYATAMVTQLKSGIQLRLVPREDGGQKFKSN